MTPRDIPSYIRPGDRYVVLRVRPWGYLVGHGPAGEELWGAHEDALVFVA